jgi:hypothetical protein
VRDTNTHTHTHTHTHTQLCKKHRREHPKRLPRDRQAIGVLKTTAHTQTKHRRAPLPRGRREIGVSKTMTQVRSFVSWAPSNGGFAALIRVDSGQPRVANKKTKRIKNTHTHQQMVVTTPRLNCDPDGETT